MFRTPPLSFVARGRFPNRRWLWHNPAFREAFVRRRCLIPFDCFYEWKKLGKDREPYAVGLADRK